MNGIFSLIVVRILLFLLTRYLLKKGKLKTRNAIRILELYEYPKEIIIDARRTEKIFD